MTSAQIAAYNSDLEKTDPAFIRCERIGKTGSMVKRRVCRTLSDWDARAAAASDEARTIVDNIQLHGSSNGQEPAGSIGPAGPN